MRQAERLWSEHSSGRISLNEQLDYYGKLTAQFPIGSLRVVYAASGKLPAAAIVTDDNAVIEHAVYWSGTGTIEEGRFLAAILNSEAARLRIAAHQARGQWGARHFDKLIFNLPIPSFDPSSALHRELASTGAAAEEVAAQVEIPETAKFQKARRLIRTALAGIGLAKRIDNLVTRLLDSK